MGERLQNFGENIGANYCVGISHKTSLTYLFGVFWQEVVKKRILVILV